MGGVCQWGRLWSKSARNGTARDLDAIFQQLLFTLRLSLPCLASTPNPTTASPTVARDKTQTCTNPLPLALTIFVLLYPYLPRCWRYHIARRAFHGTVLLPPPSVTGRIVEEYDEYEGGGSESERTANDRIGASVAPQSGASTLIQYLDRAWRIRGRMLFAPI